MPPRRKPTEKAEKAEKAEKKSKEEIKKETEEKAKALDVGDAKYSNEHTEEVAEAIKLVNAARLGYCIVDIDKVTPEFGVYNNRPEYAAHVNDIFHSFQTLGPDALNIANVIPIFVKADCIDPECLQQSEDNKTWKPLRFKEGDEPESVGFAGGRHRVAALHKFKAWLEETALIERNKLVEQQAELDGLAINDAGRRTLDVKLAERKDVVAKKEDLLKTVMQWGVAVYDEAKLNAHGRKAGRHLARNVWLPVLSEQEEERMSQYLTRLMEARLADEEETLRRNKVGSKGVTTVTEQYDQILVRIQRETADSGHAGRWGVFKIPEVLELLLTLAEPIFHQHFAYPSRSLTGVHE
ncbi:hypothetical protein PLICRDRAFT_181160 [Plicaturopsis crispa FD-325 SS-3]|uniref:Uncharacterized protein n=1 Tax=Plicaturopsis crispa FD-325 SS-3 TaxID=944288 RepID=A0A0C9SUZ4_PLICR|nr:hypothetical protein PLICRDRAFT_181160 [Plicaturopsis crispa FD-325 SS-3]